MSRSVLFAFAAAALTLPSFADPAATAASLRDQALSDPTAWNLLESLTTEIGPRPIGSPAYERARDWAVAKLRALGFTNIRVETFPKPSWQRGPESAEVVAPVRQHLAIIGLGNSVPTPRGGIEAPIVVFRTYAAMLAQPAGSLRGKIVVVNQPMVRTEDGSGYGAAVEARNGDGEAAKRGALAYLVRSVSTGISRSPHAGTIFGPGPHIPAAALGVPDADLLEALAARGPVRIRLNLSSAAHAGEVGKMIIAGESDLGADRVYQVALPLPGLDEVLAPLRVMVSRQPPRHGGSDIAGLQRAGVPILAVVNDATRYFDFHHSADDTLAVVDRAQLNQNVAVWADLVYLIADSDIDFRVRPAGR